MTDNDFSRSLGRIEGAQIQILAEMRRVSETLGDHAEADQVAFSSFRVAMSEQRKLMFEKFDEQSRERNERLDAQDAKLDELMRLYSWAKGASWPILGVTSLLAVILGGVLVEVLLRWMGVRI